MKKLVLLLALMVTVLPYQLFARQYMQCSRLDYNGTDGMVVNLTSEKEGTLFLSLGMDEDNGPQEYLYNISLGNEEGNYNLYNVENEEGLLLRIEKQNLGQEFDKGTVALRVNGSFFQFRCFSRMYQD